MAKQKNISSTITAEDIINKGSDQIINIAGTNVNVVAMNYLSAKRFIKVLGSVVSNLTITNSDKDNCQKPNLSSILECVRDIISDSLDMEWLDVLPELVKIISDSYQLGFTQSVIEEKMSLGQMLEVVIVQFDAEKKASSVAYDFFTSILKRVPGIEKITTLLVVIDQVMNSVKSE